MRSGPNSTRGVWQTDFSNPDIDYNDMTTFQLGAMVRF